MKINKNQIKSCALDAPNPNADGTYQITFSSETAGLRPYGNEIVKHDKGCVNLEHAANGLSLLFNHDINQLVGRAENIRIDPLTKQGMADIRFFSTPDAQNLEQKVKEGAGFVSYRYSIDDFTVEKSENKDEPPTVYITKSTPKEISIVSVPFDFTVGVHRADDLEEMIEINLDQIKDDDETAMACDSDCVCSCGNSCKCSQKCSCGETCKCSVCGKEDTEEENDEEEKAGIEVKNELLNDDTKSSHIEPEVLPKTTEKPSVNNQTIFIKENKSMSNERNDILALGTFAEKMGVTKEFHELSQTDKTTDEIRSAMVDIINAKQVAVSTASVNIEDQKEVAKNFSIGRAMAAVLNNDWSHASFEKEVQRQWESKQPNYAGGLIIPHEAIKSGNAMNSLTAGQGKEFIYNTYAGFVEMLRPRCLVMENGANVIGGLTMNYSYVQESNFPVVQWLGENSGTDVTPTVDTLQNKVLSPKQLAAQIQYTRTQMSQSPVAFDNFVSQRLLREFGITIDAVALGGSYVTGGVITAPTNGPANGILLDANVPTVAIGTNGGNISANVAKVLALKTTLNTNNALNGFNPVFFTTPGIQGVLESTVPPGLTYASQAYWHDNTLSGYKAVSTANLPTTVNKGASGNICHTMIFGDMSQLAIGVFGDITLTLDPYTLLGQGAVRVVANQLLDVGCTRPTAFAKLVDAIAL